MSGRIGFMQGRLSPPVDGMIQAFPQAHWRDEFAAAEANGFPLMEWTLDQERLHENPLMTEAGRAEIAELSRRHGLTVQSLTGDNFMHAPFWKADEARAALLADARAILAACGAVGVRFVVVPLVDGGRLESDAQEVNLLEGLQELAPFAAEGDVKIVFESDFEPERLAAFIAGLPAERFGINYDSGNSAGLGFDTRAEIAAYGDRIDNVHIKDRLLHGTTVPLGTGNADLPATVAALKAAGYPGDYILQTARASDGDDIGTAVRYRDLLRALLDPLNHAGAG